MKTNPNDANKHQTPCKTAHHPKNAKIETKTPKKTITTNSLKLTETHRVPPSSTETSFRLQRGLTELHRVPPSFTEFHRDFFSSPKRVPPSSTEFHCGTETHRDSPRLAERICLNSWKKHKKTQTRDKLHQTRSILFNKRGLDERSS